MTTDTARKIFDDSIAQAKAAGDKDKVATREMLREFFCNPTFRAAMTDEIARINNAR